MTATTEWLADAHPEALVADGFDDAIVGIGERCSQPTVVVYDAEKCIEILVDQGLTYEEAVEHFEFNVAGAWVGEETPIWLWRRPVEL